MGLISDLTPVFYKLLRIGIQQAGTDVVAIADLQILNADGNILATHNPQTTLTAPEKAAVVGFVTRELGVFETATGLTEWVEPGP